MNVLCVNHTGEVSGAERSLLDLMSGLRNDVNVRLACPVTGPLAGAARHLGISVDPIPGTAGSLRLHPVHTPLALSRMTAAAVAARRHALRMRADVVHANSIRAGMFSVSVDRLSSMPTVVHVRDRLPRSRVADASLKLIAGADVVAANSAYTAEGIRLVSGRGRIRVVYNPVDLVRFDSARVDRAETRARLGLRPASFAGAVIGQITPWKGQLDAVRAVARMRSSGRDMHLLIVGEAKFVSSATRYDNLAYHAELQRVIAAEGLLDRVHLLGERADVPAIMGSLDVLLVPSWEEPFGRVVVEAMAMGLPVLATRVGGPAEIIHDGVDGILLPPLKPEMWAETLSRMMTSEAVRTRLGAAARRRACDFALDSHVRAMREVYDEAVRSRHAGGA